MDRVSDLCFKAFYPICCSIQYTYEKGQKNKMYRSMIYYKTNTCVNTHPGKGTEHCRYPKKPHLLPS